MLRFLVLYTVGHLKQSLHLQDLGIYLTNHHMCNMYPKAFDLEY